MKKRRFLLFALGVIVGVLAAAGIYFLTVGEVAWQAYVEEKLVPNVVFIASTLFGLYVLCAPYLNKAKAAMADFKAATEGVCATAQKDESLAEEMRAIFSDNTALYEGLCKMRESLEEDRAKMKEDVAKLNTVMQIAFCNTKELVEKGFAAEIAKVLEGEKEKKEVSEDEQGSKS